MRDVFYVNEHTTFYFYFLHTNSSKFIYDEETLIEIFKLIFFPKGPLRIDQTQNKSKILCEFLLQLIIVLL